MKARVCSVLLALSSTALAGSTRGVDENVDDAFTEVDGGLQLRFYDAVTGKPIAGATVTFNGESGTTDGEGAVKFAQPDGVGVDEKVIDAIFAKKGYVTSAAPVRFLAGALFFNRFSVSPALPLGRVRFVLDWDKSPSDLDAHLVKEGGWHISFRDMKKFEDKAWLDRDCMSGYGAETVTVARFDAQAKYRYFVHDFSNGGRANSSALGQSKATVRVYSEAGLLKTFYVTPSLVGDKWEVFRYANGQFLAP